MGEQVCISLVHLWCYTYSSSLPLTHHLAESYCGEEKNSLSKNSASVTRFWVVMLMYSPSLPSASEGCVRVIVVSVCSQGMSPVPLHHRIGPLPPPPKKDFTTLSCYPLPGTKNDQTQPTPLTLQEAPGQEDQTLQTSFSEPGLQEGTTDHPYPQKPLHYGVVGGAGDFLIFFFLCVSGKVTFRCGLCDKVYNNKPKAQIHVRRHFTPTHVCYWCGEQFLLGVELQQHAQVGRATAACTGRWSYSSMHR